MDAAMTTSTTAATAMKQRSQRKLKAKLPPAIAHELDVMRAARMGIDISCMAPDERCKYPSKFCCNVRARKSTGKLHRFCEEHRSRANVNQKRWTEIRRRHESAQGVIDTSLALCADDSWMDACTPLLAFVRAQSSVAATPRKFVDCNSAKSHPASPTHVDAHDDVELPLSEDDIDMLTSMVAFSERSSTDAMPMEDVWLMSLLQEVEAPVVTASVFEELAIDAL